MTKNKVILFLSLILFIVFSIVYFWYGYTKFVPQKVNEVGKTFITNESIRHILKVSILNEKGYNSLLLALKNKDEDLLYDSIDFMEASSGFLHAFELSNYKIDELKTSISNTIQIIENNNLNLNYNHLEQISKNRKNINKIVEEIEKIKWEKLHFHVLQDETKKFNVIVILIYVIIFSIVLFTIILFILYQKSLLEKERVKNEKLLLNQSKVAAIGEMLGNIAHQWRQPLSVITTLVSSVKFTSEFNGKVNKEDLDECADVVLKQANYLSKTIDDFRHFFMSDSEALSTISVSKVFDNLDSLTKSIFKNNFIETVIEIEDDIVIYSNESVLLQSFINICNNTKDAFVEKNIDSSSRYFFIKVLKEDDFLIVQFRDSAGGIKENILEKIFEPYFTTKHKSLGTGIGLYMTHQLITKHCKGFIDVRNVSFNYDDKELKGALFTIRIPLEEDN